MAKRNKNMTSNNKSSGKKRAKLRQPRREPSEQELNLNIQANASAAAAAATAIDALTRNQLSRIAKRSVNEFSYCDSLLPELIDSDIDDSRNESEVFIVAAGAAASAVSSTSAVSSKSSDDDDYAVFSAASSSDSDDDSDYDVSSDSNAAADGDINREDSEQCHMQLIEQGLDEHLKSPVCNKSIAMCQTMLMRYTRFLVWLWKYIGAAICVQGGFDVCYLISSFIVQHSQLLPKYYMHLKEAYLFKASTILDHNENFQVLVHWYAVYRVDKDCYPIDPSQLYTINLIIKSMRKTFSRERKVQEATSTDNTIEGLVKSRKWPIGGLQELSDAVGSQMEWARRLCVKGCIISLSIYNLFMQLFMSSLFTSKCFIWVT